MTNNYTNLENTEDTNVSIDSKPSRTELLQKLRGQMNNKKMGRLNKTLKEQKVNQMKEKLVGGNEQMAQMLDTVIKSTKKKRKKKPNKPVTKESLTKEVTEKIQKEMLDNITST